MEKEIEIVLVCRDKREFNIKVKFNTIADAQVIIYNKAYYLFDASHKNPTLPHFKEIHPVFVG